MIHIAICDDEINITHQLTEALENILGPLQVEYALDIFHTGEGLVQAMDQGQGYELVFLDIKLGGQSGIDVGHYIRRRHLHTALVYIAWEASYALDLFDVHPLHFLIKPLMPEKIEQVVNTFLKMAGQLSNVFTYKIGHDDYKVKVQDILYLESSDRKIIIHLASGQTAAFYGALKTLYHTQLMAHDFLFIHNAYVVNYHAIHVMKVDQVVLAGSGVVLPISKHRRAAVGERYYQMMKRWRRM